MGACCKPHQNQVGCQSGFSGVVMCLLLTFSKASSDFAQVGAWASGNAKCPVLLSFLCNHCIMVPALSAGLLGTQMMPAQNKGIGISRSPFDCRTLLTNALRVWGDTLSTFLL